MAKNAPYLYIDTNITNAFDCKGNYIPYNAQTNKCRSSSPFLYNQRTSRNLQQMSLHNSQNVKHNNFHKTESTSKFSSEGKYNNRMPSPLLRSNPRLTKLNKEPEVIDINEILGKETKLPLSLSILTSHIDNFEQSRCSNNDTMGVIQAYSANTHQGIVRYVILYIYSYRTYNEDRVSIIIHINKPSNWNQGPWPKISFFGIYDGHGGAACAEYLRDNLHKLISQDEAFPHNIPEAMKNGFAKAEKDFLTNYAMTKTNQVVDKSGSCAIAAIVIDNICYVANVGDSRAIMSCNNGSKCVMMTTDHKPNYPSEKTRIIENGGKVYQYKYSYPYFLFNRSQTPLLSRFSNESSQILLGPFRVFPGRLSVSRTIGDIEAKKEAYGGLPNVIVAIPEIFKYEITDSDFVILGCDGIFDQLTNKEVNDCAWMVIKHKIKESVHAKCSAVIDMVLKAAMKRKSLDNVTCLMMAFKKLDDKTTAINDKASSSSLSSPIKPSINYCLHDLVSSTTTSTNNNSNNNGNSVHDLSGSKKSNQDRHSPVNNPSIPTYKDVNMILSKNKPNIKKLNEPMTAFSRCEKNKYPMNTAKYYANSNNQIEGKGFSSSTNDSTSVNQFLTPSHSKLSKDVSALKKKKELLLNESKYNTLHTETYTTSYPYTISRAFHMNNNNSQRYETKYRPKYSNN